MTPPLVSVIVPNYNHARFLPRRLRSITDQTLQDFEVILLDDGSTDDSVAILENYRQAHSGRVRLLVNDTNGGSPSAQWAKGIEQAQGELVWIAESDDFCGNSFLQAMTGAFCDKDVVLAFAAPTYVDEEGTPTPYQFKDYTRAVSETRWGRSYTVSGEDEVREALAIRNTIPNAAAAVFRRRPALGRIGDPRWRAMRMCGDWCFYLRLLRGRKIRFVREAESFFTHTPRSTSARSGRTETFVREHEMVLATLRDLYPDVSDEVIEKQHAIMRAHWHWVFGDDLPQFVLAQRTVRYGDYLAVLKRCEAAERKLAEREAMNQPLNR